MIKIYPYFEYWHVTAIKDIFLPCREFAYNNDFIFEETPMKDKYSYWKALSKYWGKDDILIQEHDILPTKEQLNELINCKYKDCVFLYDTDLKLQNKRTSAWSYKTLELNWKKGILADNILFYDYLKPPEFTQGSTFGFIKISKEKQLSIPFNDPIEWTKGLDSYTSYLSAQAGNLLHVHKYVEHRHTFNYKSVI